VQDAAGRKRSCHRRRLADGVRLPGPTGLLVLGAEAGAKAASDLVQRIGFLDQIVLTELLKFGAGGGGDVAADDEDGRSSGRQRRMTLSTSVPEAPGHVEIEQDGVEARAGLLMSSIASRPEAASVVV